MRSAKAFPGRISSTAVASVVFCISILLLACGAPRGAPDAQRPIVRIATSGDYPPFSDWPRGEARPRGFAPDVLGTWASATGRRVEWLRFRWPDLTREAREGRFELAAGGITVRSDRALVGTFGIPLTTSGAVVLVPGAGADSLDALNAPDVRIAVNRGGHLERVSKSRFPLAQLLPTTPNSEVPMRLARREVEAVITDTREAPVWRAGHPEWRLLGPFTRDRKAVFAAPGHEALLAELDAWLVGPVGSRTLDALRLEHLGEDPNTAHVTQLDALLSAMDERLALMPDVARIKQALGLSIEAPERETTVLEAAWRQVEAAARDAGREPPSRILVDGFFRAQIEAAKEIQRAEIERYEAAPGPVPSPQALPDLDLDLRPALIRIGARISRMLVDLRVDEATDVEALTARALSGRGLSSEMVAPIASALEQLAHEQSNRRANQ
jgi:cyclohexadienyl dehydratase